MLTTTPVLLRGHLGAKFGPRYDLAVDTPAAAIRRLCTQKQGFRKYMVESKGGFHLLVADMPVGIDELGNPTGGRSIRIIPVVSGGQGDFGRIIMGAALIAAVYYTGGMVGDGLSMSGTSFLSTMAINVGAAFVLGGVAGLLSSPPSSDSYGQDKQDPSYLFSGGISNPSAQGLPIPILMGWMEVTPVRISGGIESIAYDPKSLGSTGAADGVWVDDGLGGHSVTVRPETVA